MAVFHSPHMVTDGLALYLDAANPKSYPGSGTDWFDISGNDRHFAWSTSPVYTSAGIQSYFSPYGKLCVGPASNSFGIDNTSGYTIFVYMLQNSLASNFAFAFYNNDATNPRGITSHLAWSTGIVYVDQGGCCAANQRTSVTTDTLSWNIFAFRSDIITRDIFKNGTSIVQNTTAAADLNLISDPVHIGAFDGGGQTWDARLNSFVVYNRALTDNEIKRNFYALRGRFGVG